MSTKKIAKAKKVVKKVVKNTVKKPLPKKKPTVKSSSSKKTVKLDRKVVSAPTAKFIKHEKESIAYSTLFKDFYKEGDRIFLRNPKKFAGFPDLLDLQKRGYADFVNKYINKLFDNINPVRDIA